MLVHGVHHGAAVGEAEVAALLRDLTHRRRAEDRVLVDTGVAAEVRRRERDTDVVEERAEVDAGAARGIELERVRERRRDVAHALGVADQLAFGEIEALAEGDAQVGGREGVQALGASCERPGEVVEREDGAARGHVLADHRRSLWIEPASESLSGGIIGRVSPYLRV